MRILVVEDDVAIGDALKRGLALAGYNIDWVTDLQGAKGALLTIQYDGIILDLNLPDGSGFDLVKSLRRGKNQIPILIITARDLVDDRIKGLDFGADDYLVKPVSLEEIAARLRALIRRSSGRAEPQIIYGDIVVHPESHQVNQGQNVVDLNPKEYILLELLLSGRGRVFSRESLEQKLYGWNEEIESNAVEVHIHHLRKKLGGDLVKTIRGVGYMVPSLPK